MRTFFCFLFLGTLARAACNDIADPNWARGQYAQLNRTAYYAATLLRSGGCSISVVGIGQTNTTSAASSYTLAKSNTPAINTLWLVAVVNTKATTPDIPTLTGLGVNWVKVGTTNWGGQLTRLTLFRSMTNNTPTADALVADFAGANQTGCTMHGLAFSNVVTSGSQGSGAIVQSLQATNSSANPTVTLSALSATGKNAVYCVFANDANGYAATSVDSGWTEFIQNGYNTPATGQLGIYAIGTTDNTPSITDGAQAWAAIAIEIALSCP